MVRDRDDLVWWLGYGMNDRDSISGSGKHLSLCHPIHNRSAASLPFHAMSYTPLGGKEVGTWNWQLLPTYGWSYERRPTLLLTTGGAAVNCSTPQLSHLAVKWNRLATLSFLVQSIEASDKQSSPITSLIHLTIIKTSLFNIPLSAGAMKIAIF